MRDENYASKERTAQNRSRAAWAVAAVALVLAAGGGWLLNRPTDVPLLTAVNPAASAPMLERPSIEAAAAATPASGEPTVQRPLGMLTQSADDELRKVQLALAGSASPEATREAAQMLSVCQGADAAAQTLYNMRDQGNTTLRLLEKRGDFSIEKLLEASHDTQRRCQVFDAATLARRGELLKRAYEGGTKDVALSYLAWLNAESKQKVDPELLGKLQREARQSAEDGNFEALVVFSNGFSRTLGATPVQWQAYKEALFRIETEMSGPEVAKAGRDARENFEKTMSQWGPAPPALSAEQQREADALTERVLGAWRKRQGRGG